MAELFQRHYAASLRLARGILRSEQESLDVVQSAYFSAFRHFDGFRLDASFNTWMTRIVMNHCLMHLREHKRRINWVRLDDPDRDAGPTILTSPMPTPEQFTRSRELAVALTCALTRLPKPLREISNLCFVSGLSIKEAAELLGLTPAAAKSRLFRARARMRPQLRPHGPISRVDEMRRNGVNTRSGVRGAGVSPRHVEA
jgi:RNA polymerase sigma-70 factor (ECF subfamily)